MYESFYNLKEKPFDLHPDPDYLFMSQGHDNAYAILEYAIIDNKGFVIITGDIGSGKTTLINFFLHNIPPDIHIGLINNTYVSITNLTKMICQEFMLDVEGLDKIAMLDTLQNFLITQYAEKERVVLIIDEAQQLTPQALEEIRMISNLETEKHHLIQIILVGQPELKHNLQRKELEQFVQRVTMHCHLSGLSRTETEQYIRYRLKVAGAVNQDLFDSESIECIYEHSKGIPRIINVLCDTALVYGFADSIKQIDKKVIMDVINTRQEGGMFSLDTTPNDEPLPFPTPTSETTDAAPYDKRLNSMEQRLNALEVMVDNLRRSLDSPSKQKDERDEMILELLKILKTSLESRSQTLMHYKKYKKLMKSRDQNPQEKKATPLSNLLKKP